MFKNTKSEKFYNENGEISTYRITPEDGYVIHNKFRDTPLFDTDTGEETGEVIRGYTGSYIILKSDYDFEDNPYDIYAILKEEAGDE